MLDPFDLRGALVHLEPLRPDHARPLAAAAAEDRTTYAYTWVPDGVAEAERYVEAALAQQAAGGALVWAVRRQDDGRVVGSTRFVDLEVLLRKAEQPPTVGEIGYTWYAASAQRTGINTECKLLLLGHAFDVWAMERVTLKTDARNLRSRQAIERLGARFEGVRRAHLPAVDGGLRDTAYFSILAREWPDLRAGLMNRLARRGAAPDPRHP